MAVAGKGTERERELQKISNPGNRGKISLKKEANRSLGTHGTVARGPRFMAQESRRRGGEQGVGT